MGVKNWPTLESIACLALPHAAQVLWLLTTQAVMLSMYVLACIPKLIERPAGHTKANRCCQVMIAGNILHSKLGTQEPCA